MTLFLVFLFVFLIAFLSGVLLVDVLFLIPSRRRANLYRSRWQLALRQIEGYQRLLGDTLRLENARVDTEAFGEPEGRVIHLEDRAIWAGVVPEAVEEPRA